MVSSMRCGRDQLIFDQTSKYCQHVCSWDLGCKTMLFHMLPRVVSHHVCHHVCHHITEHFAGPSRRYQLTSRMHCCESLGLQYHNVLEYPTIILEPQGLYPMRELECLPARWSWWENRMMEGLRRQPCEYVLTNNSNFLH